MLVSLGARTQARELLDLLTECHQRIRLHVVLARRLVVRGPDGSLQEICDLAARIRRYFTLALPLHVADEDLTIAPYLAQFGDSVMAAVKTAERDHRSHSCLIDRLVDATRDVERDPARLKTINGRLSRVVESLAIELAAHLKLEERILFPAVRRLTAPEQAEIQVAIRTRRDGVLAYRDEPCT